MNEVATYMHDYFYKCQLDLVFKNWINHFKLIFKNISMPKRELARDQEATYCYAKIVREATLANKRKRVMPLMHILKL
jgi:hypothetical protein